MLRKQADQRLHILRQIKLKNIKTEVNFIRSDNVSSPTVPTSSTSYGELLYFYSCQVTTFRYARP